MKLEFQVGQDPPIPLDILDLPKPTWGSILGDSYFEFAVPPNDVVFSRCVSVLGMLGKIINPEENKIFDGCEIRSVSPVEPEVGFPYISIKLVAYGWLPFPETIKQP